jgi:hypothetical protein
LSTSDHRADGAAAADRAARCTVDVVEPAAPGGWLRHGGGVIFRMAHEPIVLSTRHAMGRSKGPLWVAGRSSMVPLEGASSLADDADAPPELRALDAAFGLLSPGQARALDDEGAWPSMADIDLDDFPGEDTEYQAVQTLGASTAKADAVLRLRQASLAEYRAYGVAPDTHLLLRSERHRGDGSISGLRGYGVWRTDCAKRRLLSGIVTDGEAGARLPASCLVATRPGLVVFGIARCLGLWPGHASVRRPN